MTLIDINMRENKGRIPGRKAWVYLVALAPLAAAGLMWYTSRLLFLISQPSDQDVLIGIAMGSGLMLLTIYIILKIKKYENN